MAGANAFTFDDAGSFDENLNLFADIEAGIIDQFKFFIGELNFSHIRETQRADGLDAM